jgi:hypothetical protein
MNVIGILMGISLKPAVLRTEYLKCNSNLR